LTVDAFLADYWGRQFVHIPGAAGRFRSLFEWDAINRQLDNQPLGARRVRIVGRQGEVPEAGFTRETTGLAGEALRYLDGRSAAALLADGASLILNAVNQIHPPVKRLAEEFERRLGDTATVNAYIGFTKSRGFDVHWDDHEVFVLQIHGHKQWRVWGRSTEAPLFRDLLPDDAPPQDLLWEGMIEDGDLLYLPRGFWHAAQAVDGPTAHLSVGIDCSTGLDVLRWLTRELRTSTAFRTDLPRFASVEERRRIGSQLLAEIQQRWTDDLIGEYLAANDAAPVSYAGAGLPASVTLDPEYTVLRWLPPRDVELQVETALGRFMELSCHGREWRLPRRSEPLLRVLVERREVRLRDAIAELAGKLDRDEVFLYIGRWMAAGLVEAGKERE
jgi:hypothetical protein